eukprot:gene9527-biopygen987
MLITRIVQFAAAVRALSEGELGTSLALHPMIRSDMLWGGCRHSDALPRASQRLLREGGRSGSPALQEKPHMPRDWHAQRDWTIPEQGI